MRPRTFLLSLLAVLAGAAVVVLPALAVSASEAKLEVNENCVEADWPCWATAGSGAKPDPASRITILAGGEVMFTDASSTAANIAWGGTAPSCTAGVPVSPDPPTTGWEGRCKFDSPGIYKFETSTLFNDGASNYTKYEVLVESAGTETTTTGTGKTTPTPVSTTTPSGTTSTPTEATHPAPTDGGSPLEGGSRAVTLRASQHGWTVHGSIEVAAAGAGGRLEIALFERPVGGRGQARIGRLVRPVLSAGTISFRVSLDSPAKALLSRRGELRLTMKITLTPRRGPSARIVRAIVVHR